MNRTNKILLTILAGAMVFGGLSMSVSAIPYMAPYGDSDTLIIDPEDLEIETAVEEQTSDIDTTREYLPLEIRDTAAYNRQQASLPRNYGSQIHLL